MLKKIPGSQQAHAIDFVVAWTVKDQEEDEIERKLAWSILQRHRYRVLEAASSVEALMLTQHYKGIVHLAVSPLVMCQIGGRELARQSGLVEKIREMVDAA